MSGSLARALVLTTIINLAHWGLPSSIPEVVFLAVNAVVALAVLYIVVGIGGGFVREAVRGYRGSSSSSTEAPGSPQRRSAV